MTQDISRNMNSLPLQFVTAMRILFDIMDDKQTGYVKLTDIENRWRDDRTTGLPRGVVESLKKVASPDGMLSFDRFCTGLKICLLKNQVANVSYKNDAELLTQQINSKITRPSSSSSLDMEKKWHTLNEDKINKDSTQNRSITMPQMNPMKEIRTITPMGAKEDEVFGPPKPPRAEKKSITANIDSISTFINKPEFEISYDVLKQDADSKTNYKTLTVESLNRGLGDGRSSCAIPSSTSSYQRSRRREPRRHTLHNGVDYNLIKRIKQIEQEKDVLLQGLNAVEEAREWYLKQLSEVQEKMRYAGRMGTYVEPWSESQQERLELFRARVHELNRQLGALAAGWRNGPLSLHMNLALSTTSQTREMTNVPSQKSILLSQNRILTEEINKQNKRISILEREKSALIREMLLQRNATKLMDNYSEKSSY